MKSSQMEEVVKKKAIGQFNSLGRHFVHFLKYLLLNNILKKTVILPIVFGILFVVFWELKVFHVLFNLELYQLPTPITIIQSLGENWSTLVYYSGYTGIEIVGGFLLGSILGILIAMLALISPNIGKGAVTAIAALNAIPIVALSPILNNWIGDSIASRIAAITLSTMVVMLVNAYKGFQSIDGTYFELMRSYAANQSQVFKMLRFKHSLPYIFTALKINVSVSIMGALVAEFFISSKGLGFLLSDQIQVGNMALAWACILITSSIGILFYYLVERLERICIPWKSYQ